MGEYIKLKALKTLIIKGLRVFKVRVIGLEPTRLAAPDPKSGMSTNFTIPAKLIVSISGCKYKHNFKLSKEKI